MISALQHSTLSSAFKCIEIQKKLLYRNEQIEKEEKFIKSARENTRRSSRSYLSFCVTGVGVTEYPGGADDNVHTLVAGSQRVHTPPTPHLVPMDTGAVDTVFVTIHHYHQL